VTPALVAGEHAHEIPVQSYCDVLLVPSILSSCVCTGQAPGPASYVLAVRLCTSSRVSPGSLASVAVDRNPLPNPVTSAWVLGDHAHNVTWTMGSHLTPASLGISTRAVNADVGGCRPVALVVHSCIT
jgi:hypothetical protein